MMKRGYSAEIEQLAAEIHTAFLEKRPPHFERGTAADWVQAVNLQMLIGQMEVAEHGLRYLRQRFPDVTYTNRVGEVFSRLPKGPTPLPFKDDPARDMQVVPCDSSETVLLMFCGAADNLGLPLAVTHRWFGCLGASLIYLRDSRRRWFVDGVASLGQTYAETIDELSRTIASLGGRRVACLGSSGGVFGALRYAIACNADTVLCFSGPVNLRPDFNAFSVYERSVSRLASGLSEAELDARDFYLKVPNPPRVRMVFGDSYWDDRIHAEHMGALPCVTLQPVDDFGEHNVTPELIKRGQFEDTLRWLMP